MNQVALDANEIKDMLTYLVGNNRIIQAMGKVPIATEIIGDSGLGKTSISLQLAQSLGMHHVKLNLAQIEELGDLVGFPIRQFQMTKNTGTSEIKQELYTDDKGVKRIRIIPATAVTNSEKIWVDEVAIDHYTKQGYAFTGQKRMGYCPPEWIADKQGGGILILDDWNRKIN